MLIKPSTGARLGLEGPMGDTMCNVKSTEDLIGGDGHENYRTEMGKWYEGRRETPLYSQYQERNVELPQATDKPSRREQKIAAKE